jgi:hypothetical protein
LTRNKPGPPVVVHVFGGSYLVLGQ